MTTATPEPMPHPGLSFRAFVALVAMLMAMNALAIDSMLPALPAIGEALGVAHDNDRQWVITAYLLGFGFAQIIYGPLSDRYGRKPVLLVSLALYVLCALACALATSFPMLIAARAAHGIAAASSRVIVVSIVRDCYAGRRMARVMSLAFIVFLAVPILAPSVGQLILLAGPWRWIFGVLAAFGAVLFLWTWTKLPETLHPEHRRPIRIGTLAEAARVVLSDRASVGYTLASSALMGALFGFINSAQQVFFDVFEEPTLFPIIFACVAGTMAVGSFLNSRIVERVGTRRVSHTAVIGFIIFGAIHFAVSLAGAETIWTFTVLQGAMMFCFSLAGANFGSMAMERLGAVAGTASSIQGTISTVCGALAGFFVGQHFDGTTVPLTMGFTLLGIAALAIVLVTERGRLFRPQNPQPAGG